LASAYSYARQEVDDMLQHAFTWGLQRLGIALAVTAGASLVALAIFVTALVAMQAFSGQ
jgi:Co/Zn/Cd efflux system component